VIDTNVIFSAAYNIHSNAGKLILSGIEGKIQLIAPEIAKKELQDALQKKLGFSIDECNEFIKSLPIEWVPESVYAPLLDRASQFIKGVDSHFVALAMLVDGILITGDREILDIKSREVKISKLAEFIKRIVKN